MFSRKLFLFQQKLLSVVGRVLPWTPLAYFFMPAASAFAQPPPPPPPGITPTPSTSGGILPPPPPPPPAGSISPAGNPIGWVPPDRPAAANLGIPQSDISNISDFYQATCAVTKWILVFGLIIGALFIIYGGVRYVTSGGEEKKSEDAKKTILTALIGVVFLILAVALVRIVASFFGAQNFSFGLSDAFCTR